MSKELPVLQERRIGAFLLSGYGIDGKVTYEYTKRGSLLSPEDMAKFRDKLIDCLRKDGFEHSGKIYLNSIAFWPTGDRDRYSSRSMIVSIFLGQIEVYPEMFLSYDSKDSTVVGNYRNSLERLEHAVEEASPLLVDKKVAIPQPEPK